jgi:hypothetical protein
VISEANEEQTEKVQNITKEAALVKIENEANKLDLLDKVEKTVEEDGDLEQIIKDAEAPLKILNPSKGEAEDEAEDADEEEEYVDTDDELNKAQNYSKQGVVDIIDNFMTGNDAFARLAPDFPD